MIQQEQSGAVMVHVQHRVEQEHKQEQEHYIVHIMDKTVELQQVAKIVIHIHVVQVHMQEAGLDGILVRHHVEQEHNQDIDITIQVILVLGVQQNTAHNIATHKGVVQVHMQEAGLDGILVQNHVEPEHNQDIDIITRAIIMVGVQQNMVHKIVIHIHAVQ